MLLRAYLAVFITLIFFSGDLKAQLKTEQQKEFERGILYLGENKVGEASEVFARLYKKDSTNLNLAYLYGQSLVRTDKRLGYAVFLLEKASRAYSPEYRIRDFTEKRVSEYVYFYLLMAYSKQGVCEKTIQTLNKFYEIYSFENEWYLVEGQRFHRECAERAIPVVEKEVTQNTPEAEDKPHIIGTKDIQYTNKQAAWGVQVGATFDPKFTWEFDNLKNVEVYVDENGIYRYIIGHFVFKQQAERLLEAVQAEGYPDAFVVNVKDKFLFSQKVITIDNKPITEELVGEVVFRVQVGAFLSEKIPEDLLELFFILDDIEELNDGQWTYLTVGKFNMLSEAKFYAEIVIDLGVEDAFVSAFNYNRKVDLRQAEAYLSEQRKIRQEEVRESMGQVDTEKKKKKKKK
jgi:hypothetical protein